LVVGGPAALGDSDPDGCPLDGEGLADCDWLGSPTLDGDGDPEDGDGDPEDGDGEADCGDGTRRVRRPGLR